MPIKNGRIYVDESKPLAKGVLIREMARCIGVGTLDLGKICEHKKVNMWSRKKHIANGEEHLDYKGDWWKAPAGSCSIEPPKRVSTFYSVLSLYDGYNNGWTRMKSIKGRALDFNGYFHYAKPPIGGVDSQPYYFNIDEAINVSIYYNADDVDETGSGSLKMSDITVDNKPLSDWYIGLALFNEERTLCKGYVAIQKGENIETIYYPSKELEVGKSYFLVPFYSSIRLEYNSGIATEGALMSIPIVQPVKFKYRDVKELLIITADAQWNEDRTVIPISIKVKNEGVTDRAVTSSYARLMVRREELQTPDEYWAENLSEGDFEIDLGITNVPKEGVEVEKTQLIPNEYRNSVYILLVRLISMNRNFDYGPEEVYIKVELS